MSGVAAVFTGSRQQASRATLACMLDEMAARGPDGVSSWAAGPVALGFLSFATTPEAAAERQPHIDRVTGSVLLLDGRLDNRDELLANLGDEVSPAEGDSVYVAASYRRWGSDAFARLLGDFAIVIWDARAQRLVCARDVMGVRPLCYARTVDGHLLVASEVRAILASGLVGADINEAHVLEHLGGQGLHRTETFFRAIQRVAPAHVLTVSDTGSSTRPFWDVDAAKAVRYRDDRQYAEHARELLGRVVRAQSRSSVGVGVCLSGGLDSSTLTAIAAAERIDCAAFTVSFPGQPCDETPFASAVAARAKVPVHVTPYRPQAPHWYEDQVRTYRELPDYPNGPTLAGAREAAVAVRRRVLLTGVGGDEWFTGSPYRYADWLTSGAFAHGAWQFAQDVRGRGWSFPLRDATLCGAWPVLPRQMRAFVKKVRGARTAVPEWIHPDASARTNLADRIAPPLTRRPGESFAQADIRSIARSGYQVHSDEIEDRAVSRAGIDQRHPFYDRRVIEFAYGLPEDQRWRGATRKFIVREAMTQLLPDAVRLRRDKAEFTVSYLDALNGLEWRGMPHLVERGWVRREAIEALRRDVPAWQADRDVRFWSGISTLWILHAVECWLAHEARNAHVGRPHQHERATPA